MNLSKFSETELQTIKLFAESLVEFQGAGGNIDFDDPDLDQAESQARDFIEAKRVGRTGKVEMEGDAGARRSVREWLKRTGRIPRESA